MSTTKSVTSVHLQPEEGQFAGNPTEEQTGRRILRRMVLECIIPMARWAEHLDPITKMMVQQTAQKKSLYEHGKNWEKVLQDFLEKDIEILILGKPLTIANLLTSKNSPPAERMEELGDSAETTILGCWHKDHGVLAATKAPIKDLPEEIQPLNWITLRQNKKDKPLLLWAWDRKNFPNDF